MSDFDSPKNACEASAEAWKELVRWAHGADRSQEGVRLIYEITNHYLAMQRECDCLRAELAALQEERDGLKGRLRGVESLLCEILHVTRHLDKTGDGFRLSHENRIRKFLCLLPRTAIDAAIGEPANASGVEQSSETAIGDSGSAPLAPEAGTALSMPSGMWNEEQRAKLLHDAQQLEAGEQLLQRISGAIGLMNDGPQRQCVRAWWHAILPVLSETERQRSGSAPLVPDHFGEANEKVGACAAVSEMSDKEGQEHKMAAAEPCECQARKALERLKGAGDRTVMDGSALISAPFLDSVLAALSAPCSCEGLRKEVDALDLGKEGMK